MIKILIADDNSIIRQSLCSLLESEPDFQIIGEARNGLEACKQVGGLKPDILVVDMRMPEMSGLEVLAHTRKSSPGTRVVVLSMYGDVYVTQALKTGASAYVLKDSIVTDLAHAIRIAQSGRTFISPGIDQLWNTDRQEKTTSR